MAKALEAPGVGASRRRSHHRRLGPSAPPRFAGPRRDPRPEATARPSPNGSGCRLRPPPERLSTMYDPIEAAQEAINSVKNTPWNSPDRLDKTELARIATATAIISGLAGVGLAIKRSDDATAEHTTALCESIMKLVASSDDNTEKMAALAD